jgi:hypothetical protein
MNILKEYERIHDLVKTDAPRFLNWIKINESKVAVCADIHAPYHSELWVYRFLEVCRRKKIKTCVIGGDLFQFDEFSKHKSNNPKASFKKSMLSFKALMTAFMEVFDEIYISKGNHDDWLDIYTEGKITFDNFTEIMGEFNDEFKRKVIVSAYPYVEINNRWRITHSKNYSIIKGSVANKLSTKYDKHICNAHGHFLSFGYSVNGKHYVIDLGGLFDRERMYYVMFSDTTHPVWNNGFMTIEDNYPTIYGNHTNWKKEGIK